MNQAAANILILRRLKPGSEAAFNDAVREWIPRAIQHPGYLGVFLLEPAPDSKEHGALLRFRTQQDWERFRDWPEYIAFMAKIKPLLQDEPRIEPLHGLEAFFRGSPHAPPSRWKMAVLTWLGVSVMVLVAREALAPFAKGWPWWLTHLATNALVVIGLAWAIMPVLTKVAHRWLGRGAE